MLLDYDTPTPSYVWTSAGTEREEVTIFCAQHDVRREWEVDTYKESVRKIRFLCITACASWTACYLERKMRRIRSSVLGMSSCRTCRSIFGIFCMDDFIKSSKIQSATIYQAHTTNPKAITRWGLEEQIEGNIARLLFDQMLRPCQSLGKLFILQYFINEMLNLKPFINIENLRFFFGFCHCF